MKNALLTIVMAASLLAPATVFAQTAVYGSTGGSSASSTDAAARAAATAAQTTATAALPANGCTTSNGVLICPTGLRPTPNAIASFTAASSANKGLIQIASDAASATDCTVGHGPNQVICISNGTANIPLGGSMTSTQIQALLSGVYDAAGAAAAAQANAIAAIPVTSVATQPGQAPVSTAVGGLISAPGYPIASGVTSQALAQLFAGMDCYTVSDANEATNCLSLRHLAKAVGIISTAQATIPVPSLGFAPTNGFAQISPHGIGGHALTLTGSTFTPITRGGLVFYGEQEFNNCANGYPWHTTCPNGATNAGANPWVGATTSDMSLTGASTILVIARQDPYQYNPGSSGGTALGSGYAATKALEWYVDPIGCGIYPSGGSTATTASLTASAFTSAWKWGAYVLSLKATHAIWLYYSPTALGTGNPGFTCTPDDQAEQAPTVLSGTVTPSAIAFRVGNQASSWVSGGPFLFPGHLTQAQRAQIVNHGAVEHPPLWSDVSSYSISNTNVVSTTWPTYYFHCATSPTDTLNDFQDDPWDFLYPRTYTTGGNGAAISTIARSGGVVTISHLTGTSNVNPSGLYAGETVTVSGVSDTSYNGTFTLTGVTVSGSNPYTYTETYAQSGANSSSTGGWVGVQISGCAHNSNAHVQVQSDGAYLIAAYDPGNTGVTSPPSFAMAARIDGHIVQANGIGGAQFWPYTGGSPNVFEIALPNDGFLHTIDLFNGAVFFNFAVPGCTSATCYGPASMYTMPLPGLNIVSVSYQPGSNFSVVHPSPSTTGTLVGIIDSIPSGTSTNNSASDAWPQLMLQNPGSNPFAGVTNIALSGAGGGLLSTDCPVNASYPSVQTISAACQAWLDGLFAEQPNVVALYQERGVNDLAHGSSLAVAQCLGQYAAELSNILNYSKTKNASITAYVQTIMNTGVTTDSCTGTSNPAATITAGANGSGSVAIAAGASTVATWRSIQNAVCGMYSFCRTIDASGGNCGGSGCAGGLTQVTTVQTTATDAPGTIGWPAGSNATDVCMGTDSLHPLTCGHYYLCLAINKTVNSSFNPASPACLPFN